MKVQHIKWLVVLTVLFSFGLGPAQQLARAGHIGEFAEAELFFEENKTDGDLGIHLKVDGEAWKRVVLYRKWQKMLDVRVTGNLRKTGLTELFSESAEPEYDEVPRQVTLDRYPPGKYTFWGLTLDNKWLRGKTLLTHYIPEAVEVTSPEEDDEVSANVDLPIEWVDAPDPHAPNSIIEFYEIVVEKDEDDELLRVFSVIMLPGQESVRCPAEFLEPGKEYKVEVIAQETTGNRSAVEIPFATEEEDE